MYVSRGSEAHRTEATYTYVNVFNALTIQSRLRCYLAAPPRWLLSRDATGDVGAASAAAAAASTPFAVLATDAPLQLMHRRASVVARTDPQLHIYTGFNRKIKPLPASLRPTLSMETSSLPLQPPDPPHPLRYHLPFPTASPSCSGSCNCWRCSLIVRRYYTDRKCMHTALRIHCTYRIPNSWDRQALMKAFDLGYF